MRRAQRTCTRDAGPRGSAEAVARTVRFAHGDVAARRTPPTARRRDGPAGWLIMAARRPAVERQARARSRTPTGTRIERCRRRDPLAAPTRARSLSAALPGGSQTRVATKVEYQGRPVTRHGRSQPSCWFHASRSSTGLVRAPGAAAFREPQRHYELVANLCWAARLVEHRRAYVSQRREPCLAEIEVGAPRQIPDALPTRRSAAAPSP